MSCRESDDAFVLIGNRVDSVSRLSLQSMLRDAREIIATAALRGETHDIRELARDVLSKIDVLLSK